MTGSRPVVSGVRLRPSLGSPPGGLLGWVSCSYGHLRLDGIALRRTRDGHLTLSYPERRDAAGRRHPVLRPLDDQARREIEEQVFAALGDLEGQP